MAVSSNSPTHLIPIDPRIYCETMNELHSYITSSKRGYLTQAELFRYYRQRHDNVEIPYRLLGYRSLLDLLSSDQRLFALDLRREPAYVYSAVKLRQQKRERRQDGTSFSRQHHSTNTLGEQHVISPDYIFFDHHVPLNEQHNTQSTDEQNSSPETKDDCSLTPNSRRRFDANLWHTPQLDEQTSLMNENIEFEESNEETIQHRSNPTLSLPNVRLSSEINDSPTFTKCENQHKPIQRKINLQDDANKYSSTRDSSLSKLSSGNLNRSISTSTTSLSRTNCCHSIDSYTLLFTVIASFVLIGIYLYKIC